MMSATRFELERLLAPVSPESFFRETWEQRPLCVERDDSEYYAGLFSVDDIDDVIAFTRPQFVHAGVPEAADASRASYVRGSLCGHTPALSHQPGIAELRHVYEDGKSLVIMAMQNRSLSIARLCRNLEAEFHCPVHANLYLTPAGSQGFAAHYDTHEVFVVQLSGSKHWRVYNHAEPLPLVSEMPGAPRRPLGKAREIRLEAGDLLYIPRGHVHEAATREDYSLHLTVGVNVYRWADLLHHALGCMAWRDVRFRESIPGGAWHAETSDFKARFRELLELLAENASLDDALRSLGDEFFGHLSMLPSGHFAQTAAPQIGPETVLERSPSTLCRVIEDEHGVVIEFPGNRVRGPHRIASALRFVAARLRFAVEDFPDDLHEDAKVVLARRLVREGLLSVVSCPVPDGGSPNFVAVASTFGQGCDGRGTSI